MLVIDESITGPQAPSQFVARDGFSRTLEQESERLKGLFLNADASAGFAELARPQVQFEHAEPDDRSARRGGRGHGNPVDGIAQPSGWRWGA